MRLRQARLPVHGGGDVTETNLPAFPDGDSGDVVLAPVPLRALPGMGRDFIRTIGHAQDAVRRVSETEDGLDDADADFETVAWAGWLTRGDSQAAALRKLVHLAEASPRTLITMVSLARIPGPVQGSWEWAVLAATDSPDPTLGGETATPVHHTDRNGRVAHD
jgi:hypothetical protein